MRRFASVAFIAIMLGCALWAFAPVNYQILKKVAVGGEGNWDYLVYDPDGHRVFVSHATHVVVLDGTTGATVGDIPDTPGVHGIALVSELGKGFISNGRGNNITVFDLKTLKATGQIAAGTNPDAILYDPASKRVFTFNGRSKDATAVDAAEGKVAGTIPLPGKPEFAVADGKGQIFVNLEDKNAISVIDSKNLKVTATWEMAGCDEPSGMAMDHKNRILFSVCGNKVMAVVSADSGKLITTVAIGDGPDAAAFDSKRGLIFSSNGDGTMTVVQERSPKDFEVVQTVKTQRGSRTMTLDEKTGTVYTVSAEYGPPPAPTAAQPHPRPQALPGTFSLFIVGQK